MTFRLEGDLKANLAREPERVKSAVYAAAQYTAMQAESFMKSQASWQDQTGAARNGLRATVQRSGNKVAIVLYHSVSYGIWLELRWDGKYAIIEPAMAAAGPLFIEAIQRLAFND